MLWKGRGRKIEDGFKDIGLRESLQCSLLSSYLEKNMFWWSVRILSGFLGFLNYGSTVFSGV